VKTSHLQNRKYIRNISQRRQRRIESRPQATCTKILVKFGSVVFELCKWTEKQKTRLQRLYREEIKSDMHETAIRLVYRKTTQLAATGVWAQSYSFYMLGNVVMHQYKVDVKLNTFVNNYDHFIMLRCRRKIKKQDKNQRRTKLDDKWNAQRLSNEKTTVW